MVRADVMLQLTLQLEPLTAHGAMELFQTVLLGQGRSATVVRPGGVLVERGQLDKTEATHGTDVGPLFGVDAHMAIEVGDVAEAFAARVAGVGTLPLVDSGHVTFVFVTLVKSLLAHLGTHRFLSF